jgi:hypothetical protein
MSLRVLSFSLSPSPCFLSLSLSLPCLSYILFMESLHGRGNVTGSHHVNFHAQARLCDDGIESGRNQAAEKEKERGRKEIKN